MLDSTNTPETTCLLDQLVIELDCGFLSNLHQPQWQRSLAATLSHVQAGQYPLKEWNDAISYILEQPVAFQTQQEAYLYLLKKLSAI